MTAMLQTFYYNEQDYVNMGIAGCIKKFYNDGIAMWRGILGGVISIPFYLCSKPGDNNYPYNNCNNDIVLITNVSIAGILLRLKDDISGIIRKIRDRLEISRRNQRKDY